MTSRSRPDQKIDEEMTREDLLCEIAELRQRLTESENCARESLLKDLERRQMEEDLRESEELLRFALVGGRMGAWKWQVDTSEVAWSEEQFRLWGHQPGDFEVNYQEWRSRVHPDDIERVEQEVFRALVGVGDFLCEYRIVWPDGSVHWVEDRARILRDERGQALALHGVMLDIQKMKESEQALCESEEQLRVLFENSPLGTVLVDPVDFRFVKYNEKAHASLGYSREEFGRLTVFDLDANFTAEEIRAKAEGFKETRWHQFETLARGKNGELHEVQLNGQGIHIRDKQYLLTTYEEISVRKGMQWELIRAKEQAEEASRVKSEFLATMSHEIRTPLTVVMAAIEHLLHLSAEPEPKSILEMADAAAQRLHNLIEDILDFSRIEAGRLEIRREPFDLRDCLDKSIGIFRLQAKEKGLQLRCEIGPEVPAVVHGDPDRLAQVFVNLIGNAVKFTSHGAVTVRIENRPDSLLVSVHDTGIGIAEDKRSRLFQSFSQVDGSLTRKYGGTGLGLAISKALVELMGGTIWVESVEGEGSVFSFTFDGGNPRSGAMPEPEAEKSKTTFPAPIRHARILLVEDDPQVRKLVALNLRQRHWEVVTANGGTQAIHKWLAGGIDLILMDLQMPDMDGLEATRIIREHEAGSGRQTPIIALTAHARLERKEKCLATGMDDFLCKPVSMEKLDAIVEKYLGRISSDC